MPRSNVWLKKAFFSLIRLDLYREQAPAPIHSMPGKQKNRDLEDALTVSQAIGPVPVSVVERDSELKSTADAGD